MRTEKPSERDAFRASTMKEQNVSQEEAGDEVDMLGTPNEARKGYQKLIRPEIVFDPDPFERTSDEIILDSGCNSVNDDL